MSMLRCALSGNRNARSSKWIRYLFLFAIFSAPIRTFSAEGPPVQLAQVYNIYTDVQEYLVSEKFDGIRAIWKEGKLTTRTGEVIHAPSWFTDSLPSVWLDGELWTKRKDFETIAATVRKKVPVDSEWRRITYMVFDAPNSTRPFHARAVYYTQLLNKLKVNHVKPVPQLRVTDHKALQKLLDDYTAAGAEGLVLHKADAKYKEGRSGNLLKLKTYMDDEAVVVGYSPGKGKYKGVMGALNVKWKNKKGEEVFFKIGTGFKDKDRANPPSIGSIITFKYQGLTEKGIPRFASCLKECGRQ